MGLDRDIHLRSFRIILRSFKKICYETHAGRNWVYNSEPLQVRIHYGPDLGAMNFAIRQSCYLFERFFPPTNPCPDRRRYDRIW